MIIYKYLLIAVLIIGPTFIGYMKGSDAGRASANAEHAIELAEYKEAINRQSEALNITLNKEAVDYSIELKKIRGDFLEVYKLLKNSPQPIVVLKNGECTLSEEYIEARDAIIRGVVK